MEHATESQKLRRRSTPSGSFGTLLTHAHSHTLTNNHTHSIRNFDQFGILACDGGKFSDEDVFIVYEDRNEHLHAETSKNGQLPMRLKVNVACEQVSIREHVDVHVQLNTNTHR